MAAAAIAASRRQALLDEQARFTSVGIQARAKAAPSLASSFVLSAIGRPVNQPAAPVHTAPPVAGTVPKSFAPVAGAVPKHYAVAPPFVPKPPPKRSVPYFLQPASVAAASSGAVIPVPKAAARKSNKRSIAVSLASNPALLQSLMQSLNDLSCNQNSARVASSRLSTYRTVVEAANIGAFPPTFLSISTYIGVAVAVPYGNIRPTVSDILQAGNCGPDISGPVNSILARLSRKGLLGQGKQKRPVTLRMIASALIGVRERCFLLLAFYGALRKKEAAALVYTKVPNVGEIGVRLERGAAGKASDSLLFDFSKFVQKGGARVAQHSRIACVCGASGIAGGANQLCVVHNHELREVLFGIKAGDVDLCTAVQSLKVNDAASHSLRVGCALHLFGLRNVDCQRIVFHCRWVDTVMLFYYVRKSAEFSSKDKFCVFASVAFMY